MRSVEVVLEVAGVVPPRLSLNSGALLEPPHAAEQEAGESVAANTTGASSVVSGEAELATIQYASRSRTCARSSEPPNDSVCREHRG